MALLYTNSPDWYSLNDVYYTHGVRAKTMHATVGDIEAPSGPTRYTTGLRIIKFNPTSSPGYFTIPVYGVDRDVFPSTLFVGTAFRWQDWPYDDRESSYGSNGYHNHFVVLHFMSPAGEEHVHLFLEPGSGHILLFTTGSRDNAGTYRACSTVPIPQDTWGYLEAKVVIHDSTGSVEVRWNGDTILTASSLDTKQGSDSYIAAVAFGHRFHNYSSRVGFHYRDMTVCDDQGTSFNTWIGDVALETIRPNGAGNYTAWTASAGSNYQCVDDATISDTDYVKTSTTTNKDTYAMSALSSTAGAIKTIGVSVLTRKEDVGNRDLRPRIRSGTTDGTGTTRRVYDGWHEHRDYWHTDPATSSAWTATAINAVECGMELVN